MSDLTPEEKIKYGDGMGGYSNKRSAEYQARWREELEKRRAESKD